MSVAFLRGVSEARYSRGLVYALSDDGTYYGVSGKGTCADNDLVIPPMYKGLPVESIMWSAFKGDSTVQSVTIPKSINYISSYAFYGCSNLKNAVFKDTNCIWHVQTSYDSAWTYKGEVLLNAGEMARLLRSTRGDSPWTKKPL